MLIGVWAIPSTIELVAEQDKLMKLLAGRAQRFTGVHLAIKRGPLPGAEVRTAYQALVRRYSGQLACSALLLEADGFWASAVRAFLTGVEMLNPRSVSKTFGQARALAEWLAPRHSAETGQRVSADELHSAIEWMLARPLVCKYRENHPDAVTGA
jgi:hypothetical protein